MAAATDNTLFLQANTLWKMLDDLADNNPDGYTKFMDKFLTHNLDRCKSPEPVFCLKTHKVWMSCNYSDYYIKLQYKNITFSFI